MIASKNAQYMWKSALSSVPLADPSVDRPLVPADLNEMQFTNLLFGTRCLVILFLRYIDDAFPYPSFVRRVTVTIAVTCFGRYASDCANSASQPSKSVLDNDGDTAA